MPWLFASLLTVAVAFGAELAAAIDTVAAPPTNAPRSTGLPLLRTFSPKDYGAQPQNWAFIQDLRGVLYVANSEGLLEFDGQRWRLIKVPNQVTVRSLAIDQSGRVYVGALGEIGYLQADASGLMRYVSLLHQVPPEARGFADIRQTFVTRQGVVFSSFDRLIRLDGDRFESWKPTSAFHFAFQVGDRIFIKENGRGLLELVGGELRLLPGSERFADEKVYAMLPGPAAQPGALETLLIGTRTQGFFLFDGSTFTPWTTAIDAQLRSDQLYSAASLGEGRLAFGTTQGGLYVIDADGRLQMHLDKANGLPDDAVTALFSDREGALWLGLGRGISRAELGNPLSLFDERNGLVGAAYAVHHHLGRLYVGTAQGLYRLEPGPHAHFARIPGIDSQTWACLSVGTSLLVANYQGVYEVLDDHAALIQRSGGSYALLASTAQPGRVFVGMEGISSLRKIGDRWQDEGQVPGINDQVRSLQEDEHGALWLGSRGTGVLRLDFSGASNIPRVDRFGTSDGLPSLSNNGAFNLDGKVHFATASGFYRFNQTSQRFEPAPRFAGLFEKSRAISAVNVQPGRGLWLSTELSTEGIKQAGLAALKPDGSYRWESVPLGALAGSNIVAIRNDDSGRVWLGGEDGLYLYDSKIEKDYAQPYTAIIRSVSGQTLGSFYSGGSSMPPPMRLPYTENNIRFRYAAPHFDAVDGNHYQVLLEGNDRDWTNWSAEDYKDYSNLFEGDYRFRVRARNLYGTLSTEAAYDFSLLPPWYRTYWAYLGYLLALAGTSWAGLRWRLRRLRNQKRALQQMVTERTAELRTAKDSAEVALLQLRSTQAQLVQSEKMASLGELVAGVAHEINTPLGIALTASSYLEDSSTTFKSNWASGPVSEEALVDYINMAGESSAIVRRNLVRAAGLVQGFKQVSVDRSSDGRRHFELKQFLDDLLQSTQSLWKQRPIEVSVSCPPKIVLDSFPGALGQVISNIIQNSLVHAFTGGQRGHLRISIHSADGDRIVVDCEDNGVGIQPEVIGRVFEPFFTTKRNHGGTGLGLHIAFNLTTQKLGGTIDVRSAPGVGTCFTLTLPIQAPK